MAPLSSLLVGMALCWLASTSVLAASAAPASCTLETAVDGSHSSAPASCTLETAVDGSHSEPVTLLQFQTTVHSEERRSAAHSGPHPPVSSPGEGPAVAVSLVGRIGGTSLRAATSVSHGIRLRFDGDGKDFALHANSSAAPMGALQETCDFSVGPPHLSQWADPKANKLFDSFIASFLSAGLAVELTAGSLLGAYRHHGTIPHDEDMDAIFNVCRFARIAKETGVSTSLASMTCTEINTKLSSMGNEHFDKWVWTEALSPVLASKGISYINAGTAFQAHGDIDGKQEIRLSNGEPQWNGGWPDMTGVGMDLHINTDEEADDRLCKCSYGRTAAYCPRDSKIELAAAYGDDFMIPLSQCDYYKKIAKRDHHADWNAVSLEDCKWADTASKKLQEAPSFLARIWSWLAELL